MMEYENRSYAVYVKVNDQDLIYAVNSSAFLIDFSGWIEVDSGFGDAYFHAQNEYFNKPLFDDRGIHQYKLVDGKPVEREREEMDLYYKPPVKQLTDKERITALEEKLRAAEILLGLEA